MTNKIDKIFNSEEDNGSNYFQIASGYISETYILFEKEQIIAKVHAEGRVGFYNMENQMLAKGELPLVESGRQVYEEIRCRVEGNSIVLDFPIYQWIDNYPNCDGEHDRWDTRKVGEHTLTFNFLEKTVICSE